MFLLGLMILWPSSSFGEAPFLRSGNFEWARLQAAMDPPELDVDYAEHAVPSLNVLVLGFDMKSFYGGMSAVGHFASLAARAGYRVRWVNLGEAPPLAELRAHLQHMAGLERLADEVEFEYLVPRRPLRATPKDVFVATQFMTAHVAAALHAPGGVLRTRRFVYFIQDVEHTFFAFGTYGELARASYALPHFALFSFDFLRQHFASERLGVFSEAARNWPLVGAHETDGGDQALRAHLSSALSYEFPVKPLLRPTEASLRRRSGEPRRLLVYARPEDHAQRNMFTLAMMALARAASRGDLDGWQLVGVGAKVERATRFYFSSANVTRCDAEYASVLDWARYRPTFLEIQPRVLPDAYDAMLARFDVGVALMQSPHPSIPPFDFAAAGMVTLTTSYGPKTSEAMAAIAENIIAVPATVEALCDGLARAVRRAGDLTRRVRGARLALPSEWDSPAALGSRAFAALRAWLPRLPRVVAARAHPAAVIIVALAGRDDDMVALARALVDRMQAQADGDWALVLAVTGGAVPPELRWLVANDVRLAVVAPDGACASVVADALRYAAVIVAGRATADLRGRVLHAAHVRAALASDGAAALLAFGDGASGSAAQLAEHACAVLSDAGARS